MADEKKITEQKPMGELTEDQLKQVQGGAIDAFLDFVPDKIPPREDKD